jgi:hypothetical protein
MSQATSFILVDAETHTAEEQLVALAKEAWRRYSGDKNGRARRVFVMGRLCDTLVGGVWRQLMEQFHPGCVTMAVNLLLTRVRKAQLAEEAAAKAAADGGGQKESDIHADPAPAVDAIATLANILYPAKPLPSRTQADKDAAAARAGSRLAIAQHRLDSVTIDGKALRNCTVAEARRWLRQRESDLRAAKRDVRFINMLIATLPSNAVIGEYWRNDNEVDQLYAKAEAEARG